MPVHLKMISVVSPKHGKKNLSSSAQTTIDIPTNNIQNQVILKAGFDQYLSYNITISRQPFQAQASMTAR